MERITARALLLATRVAAAAAVAAFVTAGPGASAQEGTTPEGLYGPPAGENTLLVRVVRAVPSGGPLVLDVGAVRFGPLEYAQVSPYRPVVRDIYRIRAGTREGILEPGEESYYTIVIGPEGVRVFADLTHRDPARAQLYLYNLSSLPAVGLSTADGRTRIVPPLPPGGSGQAAVNAVAARLGVFAGGALVAEVGDLGMRRGQSYSVFVLGGSPGPTVLTAQARVAIGAAQAEPE